MMRELTAQNTADYLRDMGRVSPRDEVQVRELTGGVSNVVLRVDIAGRKPLVIKQCRERLRVAMEWQRGWNASGPKKQRSSCWARSCPRGPCPGWNSRTGENFLFAMTCAPDDAVTWKSRLMAGVIEPAIAERLGAILAEIHDRAPKHPALSGVLADTSLFDELRVDPYYRTIARRTPTSNLGSTHSSPKWPGPTNSERSFWATSAPRTSWCMAQGSSCSTSSVLMRATRRLTWGFS